MRMKMMLKMMMSYFCGMVVRRKTFSLVSSRDHCQRSSPSRFSNTPRAGFEPAQNLSSGLVEWSCAVVITTTPRRQNHVKPKSVNPKSKNSKPKSVKPKAFSCIFTAFLESTLNFEHFEKSWASLLKYFWSYWLRETWLLKFIKPLVSENSSAVNVSKSTKFNNCTSSVSQ